MSAQVNGPKRPDDFHRKVSDLENRKIRYSASEIVIEKKTGKKSTSGFCSFRTSQKQSSGHETSQVNNEPEDVASTASTNNSSVLNLSCDSDHSDTLSLVSDISELSVLSDHYRYEIPKIPLAGVHGSGQVKSQLRHLTEQLSVLRSENAEYQKQHSIFFPNHRQELYQLKARNFSLQRENANLQSQLSSAQQLCDSLRQSLSDLQEVRNKDFSLETFRSDNRCNLTACKVKLRKAHDEIFRLKTEASRLNIESRTKNEEMSRLKSRCVSLESSTHELSHNLESANQARAELDRALRVMQSEKDTFVKSRDWYRDQMRIAQEARSATHRELNSLKKETSATIEKYKLDLTRCKNELEETRLSALKEKEELKRQLEEVLASERHRLAHGAPEEVEHAAEDSRLRDTIRNLKTQLTEALNSVQEKNSTIIELNSEIASIKSNNVLVDSAANDARGRLDEVTAALQEKNGQVKALEEMLADTQKRFSCDQETIFFLENEHKTTQQQLCDLEIEKSSLEKNLRCLQSDLLSFKDQYCKIQEDFNQSERELRSRLESQQERNQVLVGELQARDEQVKELRQLLQDAESQEKSLKQQSETLEQKLEEAQNRAQVSSELVNGESQYTPQNDVTEGALRECLDVSSKAIEELKSENFQLTSQLEEARCQIEDLVKNTKEESEFDDLKSVQARKIVRLECSVSGLEAENSHLASHIEDLETQVLCLEQTNGRLVVELQQNEAMKSQIRHLQEDLRKDTDLRKELLSAIELARTSLSVEMSELESNFLREKEEHSLTATKLRDVELRLAEKENKIDASTMTQQICTKTITDAGPNDSDEVEQETKQELTQLEEQVRQLRLKLEDEKLNAANQIELARSKCENVESELEELRAHCKVLTEEILDLTQKADAVSEEKNLYRSQVHDMNTALKTSLGHIQRLRTHASASPSASQSSTPTPPVSPLHNLPDDVIQNAFGTSPVSSQNLSNLQQCLASLKSEMFVLQSKLTPSPKKPRSNLSSVNSSPTKIPLKSV